MTMGKLSKIKKVINSNKPTVTKSHKKVVKTVTLEEIKAKDAAAKKDNKFVVDENYNSEISDSDDILMDKSGVSAELGFDLHSEDDDDDECVHNDADVSDFCSDDFDEDSSDDESESSDEEEQKALAEKLLKTSQRGSTINEEEMNLDLYRGSDIEMSEEDETKVKQCLYPKQTEADAIIDESTEEGKFMKDIEDRKEMFHKRVIFVNKLNRKNNIDKLIETVSDCNGSYIRKPQKRYLNQGNCFLYFTTEEKAREALKNINDAKLNNGKVVCSLYNCTRVYNNFMNVNLVKLIGASNVTTDIKTKLQSAIGKNCTVSRLPNGYYEILMNNSHDAFILFNKKYVKVDGAEVLLNYSYELKNTFENVLPVLPIVGKKRSLNNLKCEQKSKRAKKILNIKEN